MQAVFAFFNTSWVRTILITFHILILFGTNKWAYSVICQFWPIFSLNFFLASRKYVHYLHYYLAEQHIARANLDKLGYLVCFENNSFISHISPKKVPKSWQNIMCKMKIHCRMNLVVKIENPSSNLLEICSYISSFLHCWQRPLSCWSWHGRNDFWLLINRTWKLLAKVFKWSPIACLLLLTVMKNPEKYECGSLRVKISKCGRFYTPARERTSKREISGISSFVREGWQVCLIVMLKVIEIDLEYL